MILLFIVFLRLFTSIIYLGPSVELNSITDNTFLITDVSFKNNVKSKEEYLLTALNLEFPGRYEISHIEEKVKSIRIINGIFNTSYSLLKNAGSGYILVIYVDEQKTLLPIVNVGIQPTNIWFQIGLTDINFMGMGNILTAYYQNNQGRHSAEIFYKKNNVASSKFGYYLNGLIWQSFEPLNFGNNQRLNYFYSNNLLGGGMHFDNRKGISLAFGGAYFTEYYERELQLGDLPGPSLLNLNKLLGKIEGRFSNIEYQGIYKDNLDLFGNYQSVYTFNFDELFHIFQLEASYFRRISQKNQLAARIVGGIASDFNSPFAPFLIDSYSNVRGAGDRTERGTAIASYNIEWRYELGAIGQFIFQTVMFNDGSQLRIPAISNSGNSNLENYSGRVSLGTGLRVNYTKIFNAVLRIDLAHEITTSRNQVVVGVGQFF